MTFVVDANVIVKLFVEERQSGLARELFSSNWTLWAPAHFLGEVGEVFCEGTGLARSVMGSLTSRFWLCRVP